MERLPAIDTKLSAGLLLYGYAVSLGAAYIFSFWRPFGFNIFPFLTVTDFVTIPFNRLSILLAPLALLLVLQFAKVTDRTSETNHRLFFQLVLINIAFSLVDFARSATLVFNPGYVYTNEKSIFAISILFYAIAGAAVARFKYDRKQKAFAVLAIVLSHLTLVMANGYRDGKLLYMGAESAYYLQQRELCSPPTWGNWVYLDKYGSTVFFMNTTDKRLCLLKGIEFNLVDRKVFERVGL